jgi:hypothetical protein
MKMLAKAKLLFKVLLSLWVVYHLLVIIIMPNGGSYLVRRFGSYLLPYANTLNLNTPWNFFSPDPAHIMYFKYTVYFRDDFLNDIKDPIEGYFPAGKEQGAYSASERRELYAMRYMIIDPKRVEKFLGPWLCSQNPGASGIKLEHIVDTIPPLDRAVSQKSTEVKDMGEEIEIINRDFDCHGANDEVSS